MRVNKGSNMKLFTKILKAIFIGIIISAVFINVYFCRENHKSVTDIIKNQALIVQLQAYFNEINTQRNKLIEDKVTYKLDKVDENKPSFEYLKSLTVRMTNVMYKNGKKMASTGTGSIVKVTEDFTYILTNKHVAPTDAKQIFIEKDGKKYKGRVIKNGVTRDLSLVRMVGKIPNTGVVKGFKKTKEQDKIYSVGMYFGFQDIYSEGNVAGWTPNGSRLINMPAIYGCSGSGVYDADGYMVAVVYAVTAYSPFGVDSAKAWCVPYIGIMAFLEEIL